MLLRFLMIGFLLLGLVFGCAPDKEYNAKDSNSSGTVQGQIPDLSSLKSSEVTVYKCGDSLKFTAHITRDSTWLFLPDTTLKVMPVPSGSGQRYEGNDYLFWVKEQEAILQRPRGSFMTCRTVPMETSDTW